MTKYSYCKAQVGTGVDMMKMSYLTWEQEERAAIVSCPMTVLSLEVSVEVHTFQSSIHSRVGGRRARHELSLWGRFVIRDEQVFLPES